MPSSRVITLTTDFGLADHYVGTMKGVILSVFPHAIIVDISHEVPAFSLYAGAYTIAQAAPYFPPGTVHVVVVDPGVGTLRKPLLIEACGHVFIAPDNGVLSMILAGCPDPKARVISIEALWLNGPSATFHGRDIFAPVAAAIATGRTKPSEVGPLIDRIEMLPDSEPKHIGPHLWRGRVLSIDRFGNIITNFKADDFEISSESFSIGIGGATVKEHRRTFGDALKGSLFAYRGSSRLIEVAINQGNAAKQLGVSIGDPITLRL